MQKINFPEMEKKWQHYWEEHNIYKFRDDGKKPLYVIDSPPPFPTGEFHTGSTLNWGYIDFAARFKRMSGYAVLFPQGWDCHGFPTETKVEQKYGKLPREEFRKRCLEWTHEMVASIKSQMKQMGFSIDWKHEYYTIDKEYHRKVQLSLLQMHEKGMVYRGKHPVPFCTHCESAIAKAETDEVERDGGLLNYVKFKFEGGKELEIATSRPELIHACAALAYNPSDERYKNLEGKMAFTPIFNKPVRIYADNAVDKDFGSGMVMICTFGDRQDVIWAYKYNLPIIEAFDGKGRVLNANEEYNGLYANKARAKIVEELREKGLLERQEKITQMVKVHDRCKKPVELLSSNQWFIKVKENKEMIVAAAEKMQWHPPHALQLLKDWAEGLEWDWVISRQRVFGIPIPFYYCEKCGEIYPAEKKELPVDPALKEYHKKKCSKCNGNIIGETSICDGWVDSSITPLIISKWEEDESKFKRWYPSAVRPQGTDIIRTWAFYTIFRCLMLTGKPPFTEMLVNGMVLGADGKKMSKSAGNYIEAKEVIEKSSVDALRQWIALSGSTGKDNIFYWKDVNYAQGFLTKLWNVAAFIEKGIEGFEENETRNGKLHLRITDKWIMSRLQKTIKTATAAMNNYDYYEAIIAIQTFFWKELADFYLEEVKYRIYQPEIYGKEGKLAAQYVLKEVLMQSLKLLSPFICYTTEEIYHQVLGGEAKKHRSIHLEKWPEAQDELADEESEKIAEILHKIISEVRRFKASNKLPLNEKLQMVRLHLNLELEHYLPAIEEEIKAVGKAGKIELKIWKGNGIKVECIV